MNRTTDLMQWKDGKVKLVKLRELPPLPPTGSDGQKLTQPIIPRGKGAIQ